MDSIDIVLFFPFLFLNQNFLVWTDCCSNAMPMKLRKVHTSINIESRLGKETATRITKEDEKIS